MAYKSFIKSIGSTKGAGVGFLPVPKVAPPPVLASGTFTSIADSGGFVNLLGVVETVGVLEVGTSLSFTSVELSGTGIVTGLPLAGSVVLDTVFTIVATAGTYTEV